MGWLTRTFYSCPMPKREDEPNLTTSVPVQIRVAAFAVGVQALTSLGVAVWLSVALATQEAQNPLVAQGSALYFAVFAVLLAILAIQLFKRASWTHGPAVFVQFLTLALAWNMAQAQFWVGVVLAVAVAGSALAALLSSGGRAALGR